MIPVCSAMASTRSGGSSTKTPTVNTCGGTSATIRAAAAGFLPPVRPAAPIVVDPQGGPHLPVAMLVTFLYMFGVFTLLFTAILAIRYRLARTQLLLDDLEVAS